MKDESHVSLGAVHTHTPYILENKRANELESFLDSNRNYFQKSITSNFNDNRSKENLNFIQNRNKNIKVKEKRNNTNCFSSNNCSFANFSRHNNKLTI